MLYVAAGLLAVLAIGHSIIGEVRLIRSLAVRDDLPVLYGTTRFTGATLRFAWHVTSVLGLALAILLVEIALGVELAVMTTTIGWALIACGVLPLVFTRGRHVSWVIFFVAGVLCLIPAPAF